MIIASQPFAEVFHVARLELIVTIAPVLWCFKRKYPRLECHCAKKECHCVATQSNGPALPQTIMEVEYGLWMTIFIYKQVVSSSSLDLKMATTNTCGMIWDLLQ